MKFGSQFLPALALMTLGWASAFLLASFPGAPQGYWLGPAAVIGVAVGLSLRKTNGCKTALMVVFTAALGLLLLNLLFPEKRITLAGLKAKFRGESTISQVNLQVPKEFSQPPFDRSLTLTAALPLEIGLQARLPGGVSGLCLAADGSLYASLPKLGAVYRLKANSNPSLKPELLIAGLDSPSGLICDKDELLVAESSQIGRYASNGERLGLLVEGLPVDGGELKHRLLRIPSGLLISIGSRCDACKEKDPRRGTLQLLSNAGELHPYASGLRQLGGITTDPVSQRVWLSERSRQYPQPGAADEVNLLQINADYGWPNCEAAQTSLANDDCQQTTPPERVLLNRANPAGILASSGLKLPQRYGQGLLLILAGQENPRVLPALVYLPLAAGKLGAPRAFLGGWDPAVARPGPLAASNDGGLYIGDELNGAIYRVSFLP